MSEVVNIDIDQGCMECYPCKHFCTLSYQDGTSKKTMLGAIAICKYWNLLTDDQKQHFQYALDL